MVATRALRLHRSDWRLHEIHRFILICLLQNPWFFFNKRVVAFMRPTDWDALLQQEGISFNLPRILLNSDNFQIDDGFALTFTHLLLKRLCAPGRGRLQEEDRFGNFDTSGLRKCLKQKVFNQQRRLLAVRNCDRGSFSPGCVGGIWCFFGSIKQRIVECHLRLRGLREIFPCLGLYRFV